MYCGTREKLLPAFEKKWRPTKECDRTKLLTLRHPTTISKLSKSIPRPVHRPIKSALPIWDETELNEKICTYHGHTPTGPLVFHRGLMGYNPLQVDRKLNFSLDDPHCRQVSYEYNPLHDPHLKNWLNKKHNRVFMLEQGLVTDDEEVICNLKQYNQYRRVLWSRHNHEMTRLLKLKDQQNIERQKIVTANVNHEKNLAKKVNKIKFVMSKNKSRKAQ